MTTLYLLLYVAAAVCFALAVLLPYRRRDPAAPAAYAGALIPLGLLLWVLVPLIVTARRL